jgi:hemerythrin-like domain-containing protein
MALIHNILLRGFNCIYLQALNVKKPEDIANFMAFCDAWSCTLRSHHNTEETVYFPLLEEQCQEKGIMARNHAEHETFLPGLLAFDEYVSNIKDYGKSYDGNRVVRLVEDLGPTLETHLRNEIVLLEGLAKDDQIDWDLLGKTMAKHSKKVADRVRMPFISLRTEGLTLGTGSRGPFPDYQLGYHLRVRHTRGKISSVSMVCGSDISLGIYTTAQGSLEIR